MDNWQPRRLKHRCGHWQTDLVPVTYPAWLLYARRLRREYCLACIADGYAAETVERLLHRQRRRLFGKKPVLRLPTSPHRPAA